jgi:hypothetical protein
MAGETDNRALSDLAEAIRQQTAVNDRIARSLANLEALFAAEFERREEERREQAQDREESRARMREWDREHARLGLGRETVGRALWAFPIVSLLTLALLAALAVANVIHLLRR